MFGLFSDDSNFLLRHLWAISSNLSSKSCGHYIKCYHGWGGGVDWLRKQWNCVFWFWENCDRRRWIENCDLHFYMLPPGSNHLLSYSFAKQTAGNTMLQLWNIPTSRWLILLWLSLRLQPFFTAWSKTVLPGNGHTHICGLVLRAGIYINTV